MKFQFFAVFLATLMLTACGVEPSPQTDAVTTGRAKPLIITSNYPLYYFAREIAGDSAEVVFPSMQGDPANWKPAGDAIAQMQSADLVILNGAGYESWLSWVTLPDDVLVDTSAGIHDRLLPLVEETIHQHGPQGEHSHQGLAFTIWLDPMLATEQARIIENAISRLLPDNQAAHRTNLAALEERLAVLDQTLQSTFSMVSSQALVFSHPVYQYLAARYGLKGVSMHWEPGEDPGVKAWIDFQEILRRQPAGLMIWEDEPGQQTADKLAQMGVWPIVFHTASNPPAGSDYFELMNANIERLGAD